MYGSCLVLVRGFMKTTATAESRCIYTDDDNIVTRIENPEKSPYWKWPKDDARYLTREEVLSQEEAKQWVIDRRLDFVENHHSTANFLRGASDAKQ